MVETDKSTALWFYDRALPHTWKYANSWREVNFSSIQNSLDNTIVAHVLMRCRQRIRLRTFLCLETSSSFGSLALKFAIVLLGMSVSLLESAKSIRNPIFFVKIQQQDNKRLLIYHLRFWDPHYIVYKLYYINTTFYHQCILIQIVCTEKKLL